ncbi:MAG: hypothetical protein ABIU05_27050, partial [Nitrospirales bacterium]
NSVLPRYIGASGGTKTGSLPDQQPAVQVGDTLHRQESSISHGIQRFDPSFNRTLLDRHRKTGPTLLSLIVKYRQPRITLCCDVPSYG